MAHAAHLSLQFGIVMKYQDIFFGAEKEEEEEEKRHIRLQDQDS